MYARRDALTATQLRIPAHEHRQHLVLPYSAALLPTSGLSCWNQRRTAGRSEGSTAISGATKTQPQPAVRRTAALGRPRSTQPRQYKAHNHSQPNIHSTQHSVRQQRPATDAAERRGKRREDPSVSTLLIRSATRTQTHSRVRPTCIADHLAFARHDDSSSSISQQSSSAALRRRACLYCLCLFSAVADASLVASSPASLAPRRSCAARQTYTAAAVALSRRVVSVCSSVRQQQQGPQTRPPPSPLPQMSYPGMVNNMDPSHHVSLARHSHSHPCPALQRHSATHTQLLSRCLPLCLLLVHHLLPLLQHPPVLSDRLRPHPVSSVHGQPHSTPPSARHPHSRRAADPAYSSCFVVLRRPSTPTCRSRRAASTARRCSPTRPTLCSSSAPSASPRGTRAY